MPNPPRLARVALLAALTLTMAHAAPAPAVAQSCAGEHDEPGAAGDFELRQALRCVINAERAQDGLRPLRHHPALRVAAQRHADDMVERGYFAHERRGSTPASRLRRADWDGDAAAEAIAWGCGGLGGPRAIVDGWLASPPHRALVLGRFSRAGVGLRVGSPHGRDCPGAGTWVLVAGRR